MMSMDTFRDESHPPTAVHAPAEALAGRYASRAAEISEAIRTLAGPDSGFATQILALTAKFGMEWERIATNRGLDLPTIALVGGRNVGKSTLCGLLINDPKVREAIQSGEAEARKTDRLQWFGPSRPPNPAEGHERYVRVSARHMANLGRPYMLLDAPGAGDMDSGLRERAAMALSSARYKALVLDAGLIEALDGVRYMQKADGSVILPVVRLRGEQTRELGTEMAQETGRGEGRLRAEYDQSLATLRTALPLSTVLPCILLPDLDAMGDPEQARRMVRDRLIQALRSMLAEHQEQAEGRIEELAASWERFRVSVGNLLESLLTPGLRTAFANLEGHVAELPGAAATHLLADQRRIKALLRADLRLELLESVPVWAFPLRSLTGLLCHAAGALDRVILALGGSLPSLTMTGFRALKNVTEQSEARAVLRDNLKDDLRGVVQQKMSDPMQDFGAAVQRAGGGHAPEERSVDFDVQGVEDLAASWERSVRDSVKTNAPRKTWVRVAAVAATLFFLFLIGGPLAHVYGQYVPAAWGSWKGEWTTAALTAYPSMPAGFWFSAVLLSVLPVFVAALVLVGVTLRPARVERCAALLRDQFTAIAVNRSSLRITIRDKRIAAARLLLKNRGEGDKLLMPRR